VNKVLRTAASVALLATGSALPALAQNVELTGAGSSFAYPIYTKWASEYVKTSGVKVNPVAVVLDDDHAATAPDAFVNESLARGVRLVAVPTALARPLRSQLLRDALREARRTYDGSPR